MTQAWTINNVDIDDLPIDTLVFNVQNQDEDYCEIRLKANFDAALPEMFQVGATVVIRYGSTVIFRGEVDNPLFSATFASESDSIFVYGPWHFFSTMPFLYLYPYVTGTQLSTHGVVGGDANSILTAILQTNAADIVQIGYIDVGTLTIPETEVYDQKLSETLQSILRFIPGALVIFDYSTQPPTIHILADNSTHLASVAINPADGSSSNFRLKPFYDRLVDGVTLQYEASGNSSSGTQQFNQTNTGNIDTISSPVANSGFFLLGTDSAGDATSRRHFRRTLRLEGAYDVSIWTLNGQLWPYVPNLSASGGGPFNFYDLTVLYPESGTSRRNKLLMVDRAMFFRMYYNVAAEFLFNLGLSTNASQANAGVVADVSSGWISDSTGGISGADWGKYMRPLMRIGGTQTSTPGTVLPLTIPNLCKWERSNLASALLQTSSASGLRAYGWNGRWDFTNTSGQSGYASQATGDGNQIVFLDTRTLGSVNSTTGRFTYVRTVSNSSLETPAPGIAAQILAANSRLLYDGGVTLLLEDSPERFFGLNRKAVVSSPSASTVIQRFTLDVATGLADLTFGAPVHLGPQDLISLYRAGLGSA